MNNAVLVTGANGFLGRHLTASLSSRGYRVERHSRAVGDIARDPVICRGVGHVFHLAGRSFVPESWQNPFLHYEANVLGTANVLELCRRQGAALIFLSSYVYGNPQTLPIDEEHPVAPFNPYSHSKILAEETARFYAARFGVPVVIVRAFNIYGPGQADHFLMPTIARQMLAPDCEQITVQDSRPKRDYLFVDDFMELLLAVLERPAPAAGVNVFNAGAGQSVSIEELAAEMNAITGLSKKLVSLDTARPDEIMDVYAAIGKAKRELGWSPRTSLREGLRQVLTSLAAESPAP